MAAMTSAEYRTLREACGLSQQGAADFHDVALRTVVHWETGRNNIPPKAAQKLRELNEAIERSVAVIVAKTRELSDQHGKPDAVALARYRTAEDYAGSRPDSEGLPWACHNALIGRALVALERAEFRVEVVWA
jgi:DNA-binding XRE family transcriptional regulator